jgi:large subunit ribosomal protein L9
LAETTVKIVGTAGADGRFYGSVTTKDISEALASQFGIEIDKRKMELDMQIKAFGTYKVEVKLYTGISGKFNVQVVEK